MPVPAEYRSYKGGFGVRYRSFRQIRPYTADYVLPKIYPEAEELAYKHAEQGHIVALVSGASKFVLRPLAAPLNIKHIMHTHLEVKDGRFSARLVQPICFGEGKIYWVQQLTEPLGIDLAKSYFYSDSITDLPLLEVEGHPQIVNPDPLLCREARLRHWPVRFFRDPLSSGG